MFSIVGSGMAMDDSNKQRSVTSTNAPYKFNVILAFKLLFFIVFHYWTREICLIEYSNDVDNVWFKMRKASVSNV